MILDLNLRTIYRFILVVLFLVIFVSFSRHIHSLFRPEFDAVDTCSFVVDGDTFDISSGNRIRLADVDTPERGEYGYAEATRYLENWIYGKTVYLDVDDVHFYDTTGTRIVCVVYVEYESGRYLNINQALLDEGLAVLDDYDNEFSPYLWRRTVSDLSTQFSIFIIGVSFVTSLVVIVIIIRIKNQIQRTVSFRMRRGQNIGKE